MNNYLHDPKEVHPYSDEEVEAIRKLYIDEDMILSDVVIDINRRFWYGADVRTDKAIERKLNREKIRKRYNYSKFETGKLSDIQKEIFEMKKTMSFGEIAKTLNKKLSTVKGAYFYFIGQLKRRKNLLVEAGMRKPAEQKIIEEATKESLFNKIALLEKNLLKAKTVNNIIVDTVKEAVTKLPKNKAPNVIVKKSKYQPETVMLEFGDTHVGEKIEKSELANLSEYNFDIFCKRMDIMWNGIKRCVDIQRSKISINTLDINMIGDFVTGEDIYLGQARSIDMPLIQQTMESANMIEQKLITPATKLFNKVRIRAVYGNHGRIGKPNQFHVRTNFDYIIYQFLKERYANNPQVEIYISEVPLMLFQLPEAPNYTHLLSHGNEVNSSMSVPFYGMQRDHGKYMQLFGMNINYWHLGHFHNSAKIDVPFGEQIVNGTFVGGSELSVFKMKTKSQPKQVLFGFNGEQGITWKYDLLLDVAKPLEINNKGIFTPTYIDKRVS